MLVLTRKIGEEILIGGNIRIVVNRVAGNRVTLGIEAPREISVVRTELIPVVQKEDDEQSEQSAEAA